MDWEFGIIRCKLLYIEWINNKDLLYSTGNSIQYLVITYDRKESGKEYIFTYIYLNLNHLAVHLNRCKSTILQ